MGSPFPRLFHLPAPGASDRGIPLSQIVTPHCRASYPSNYQDLGKLTNNFDEQSNHNRNISFGKTEGLNKRNLC